MTGKKHLIMTSVNGVNKYACPNCGTQMEYAESGSMHFNKGEVWDDIEGYLYCPHCGLRQDYPKMRASDFRRIPAIG
jgi:DNA-directed RNA polymerase subunit RPC12/RpoP